MIFENSWQSADNLVDWEKETLYPSSESLESGTMGAAYLSASSVYGRIREQTLLEAVLRHR